MSVQVEWRGDQVLNATRAARREGMFRGASHIKERSNAVCPIEEGTLIRSSGVSVSDDGSEAAIYYDTIYARRQHEELTWRHDPGRQAKYLEEPFNAEITTAQQIVATHVRRAIGS